MHIEWLNFLENTLNAAADFSENSEFLCSTEHLGLIQVDGDDSLSFMQNQFSNDIALIDDTSCQLNSYSSHKGRMFSIFYVMKYQQGYLIIAPKSQLEFLLQRLQMFVIMAKVTLQDVSEQWAKIGYQSESVATKAMTSSKQITSSDETIQIRINPDNQNRILVLTRIETAQTMWNELSNQLTICTSNAWHLAEINEGIPSLTPETSEAFVLQMSNLQVLNGVSFKKGCFPGQEIVARTKYLGKAKRRMYLAQIQSTTQPLASAELCAMDAENADGSGKVVLSALSGDNQYDFLFVGNIKKTEENNIKLVDQPSTKLILKKLPYSFEE